MTRSSMRLMISALPRSPDRFSTAETKDMLSFSSSG
jgi:hypothetical protein